MIAICAKTEKALDERGQKQITKIVINRAFLKTCRFTGLAEFCNA